MIIVILILLIIGSIFFYGKYDDECEGYQFALAVILSIFALIVGFIFFSLVIDYPYNIDQKIKMYTQENNNIETKVKQTVQAYMNYEQDTYKNLVENSDLQILLIKYPELNSNELVRAEIETYKENNNKIRELKDKAIDKKIKGFWYFFNIGVKD